MNNFSGDSSPENSLEAAYRGLTENALSGDPDITPAILYATSNEADLEEVMIGFMERMYVENPEDSAILEDAYENSEDILEPVIETYETILEENEIDTSEEYKEIRDKALGN